MRLALAAAALTALVLAGPAEAGTIERCRVPGHAKTEAVGGRLVAWSVAKRDQDDDLTTSYYVCRRGSGRVTFLAKGHEWLGWADYVTRVTVAGRFVAFVRTETAGKSGSIASVTVHDAASGRTVRTVIGVDWSSQAYWQPSVVQALVLTRTGALAYVIRHPHERDGRGREREQVGLRALDAGGRRLLDKGPGIDPASLRHESSTVHWTNAGEPRSAPLR
jgi:hypothetical protein